jgi:hypothetical protein
VAFFVEGKAFQMKIKITTDNRPWVDDLPRAMGEVVDTDDATAKIMIGNGHAEAVKKARKHDA